MAEAELTNVTLSYGSTSTGTWTAYVDPPVTISLPQAGHVRINRTNTTSTATQKGKGIADVSDWSARFEYNDSLYTILDGQSKAATDIYFKATIVTGDYVIWKGQVDSATPIGEAGVQAFIDVVGYANSAPTHTAGT